MNKTREYKPAPGERQIDDLMREIGDAVIGVNDDGSFFAPDGTLWFPVPKRNAHGWFFPCGKLVSTPTKS